MSQSDRVAQFFANDVLNQVMVKNRLEAFIESSQPCSDEVKLFVEVVVRIHLCEDINSTSEHIEVYKCIFAHNSKRRRPSKKYRHMNMLKSPAHIEAIPIARNIICPGTEYASQL